MEFRKQELLEEVYSAAPLQQSAFAWPLPSPPSSSSAQFFARGGEAMGSSSLAQKPSSISAAADGVRPETEPRYRECLRNHAASVGGHVLDGCCEFMPSAGEALKCAACGCHRSFHWKDGAATTPLLLPPPAALPHGHPKALLVRAWSSSGAAAAAGTESSSEDLAARRPFVVSRKRSRTKFTNEQKEKMQAFAEKVGWRMQGGEDGAVEHFCGEVGVRRHVFKVWMHNNKNSLKKQNHPQQQLEDDEDQEEEQQHRNQQIHLHQEMAVD